MTLKPALLVTALLSIVLSGAPVVVEAGAASQAVRREIVRRAELTAAERAALQAAEQQATRQAAAKAAQQQAGRQAALRAALARDARRDAATKAAPLKAERRVWRYTSKREAARELKNGVPAGAHMTPGVRPGRPPGAATAQRQYGLPKAPEARMKIRLNRGTPVAHNKALAGQPGRGELTAPAPVPKENIEQVIVLR